MKIKVKDLESLIRKTLSKKYDEESVDLIIPVMLFGELSGKQTHGIVRLVVGKFSTMANVPVSKPSVIKKSAISRLVDLKGGPGMLGGAIAVNEVIGLAKKNGIGIVGTHGAWGSSGTLSYYLEKIAKENLIGVIMARAVADVLPFNSREKLIGTNPISFGIPLSNSIYIFDMATSSITRGEIVKAKVLGTKLPDGVAVDGEGKFTTDPDKAIEGGILPFANSYKGAGLGLVVEMLAGVLTGADFAEKKIGDGWGNLFIAFKPDLLMKASEFKSKASKLIEIVRNSVTRDGLPVRIPGEQAFKIRDKNLKNGWVEVDDKLIDGINNYLEVGEIQ